jgi:hypothetical protein
MICCWRMEIILKIAAMFDIFKSSIINHRSSIKMGIYGTVKGP